VPRLEANCLATSQKAMTRITKGMFKLPKPDSFEDGQRQFFGLAMVAAGIFAGLISVGLIGLFWGFAVKFPALMKFCLTVIAGGFAGFLVSMIIVIISMAVGGPVGRFKVHASRDGLDVEASGDGEAVAPVVITQANPLPESPVE
jgi:hypothetical protein